MCDVSVRVCVVCVCMGGFVCVVCVCVCGFVCVMCLCVYVWCVCVGLYV